MGGEEEERVEGALRVPRRMLVGVLTGRRRNPSNGRYSPGEGGSGGGGWSVRAAAVSEDHNGTGRAGGGERAGERGEEESEGEGETGG